MRQTYELYLSREHFERFGELLSNLQTIDTALESVLEAATEGYADDIRDIARDYYCEHSDCVRRTVSTSNTMRARLKEYRLTIRDALTYWCIGQQEEQVPEQLSTPLPPTEYENLLVCVRDVLDAADILYSSLKAVETKLQRIIQEEKDNESSTL